MNDTQLYQEILMDHYRYPRNGGTLINPDFLTESFNPSCGDSVTFAGKVFLQKLIEVKFQGKGCVISQAAASLLTERVKNNKLVDIHALDVHTMQLLLGMQLGPTRLRCALLPLEALQKGIHEYAQSHKGA